MFSLTNYIISDQIYLVPSNSFTLTAGSQSYVNGTTATVVQDHVTVFSCSSLGSRPAAVLTWMKDGSPIDGQTRNSSGGRVWNSYSDIYLAPGREDHKKSLECHSVIGTIHNMTQVQLSVNGMYDITCHLFAYVCACLCVSVY